MKGVLRSIMGLKTPLILSLSVSDLQYLTDIAAALHRNNYKQRLLPRHEMRSTTGCLQVLAGSAFDAFREVRQTARADVDPRSPDG